MNSIGLRYDRGDGVAKDRAQAVRWFDDAARHGSAAGAQNLANAYASGDGVPADGARAQALYFQAITRFLSEGDRGQAGVAELCLCKLYLNPQAGVANAAEAIKAAGWAASMGNPAGWACLAVAARSGTVLPRDPVACYGYYRKGADARDPTAMCGMGFCLENGVGCPVDLGQAAEWYRRAAYAGSTDGMVGLGTDVLAGQDVGRRRSHGRRMAPQGI